MPLNVYWGTPIPLTRGAVQGVCALTNCPEPNLVALPASATAGTICIYNLLATGVNVLCEVEAHRTPVVSCYALCPVVIYFIGHFKGICVPITPVCWLPLREHPLISQMT